jgi:class 3 adenylate cyclase
MDQEPSIQRRLAAILAADIAGYSRLMHEDEAATVRDLKSHQSVILPLVGRHGGRIIDTAGDGLMAEFPSVIGATECAVEIQTVMAQRNEGVADSRRMLFRIGLNLGDVIHDDTRIYGDGINIAARLEALAEPGNVLVSSTVYDHVRGKLPITFADAGERQLKNIAQPVRTYRVLIPGTAFTPGAAPLSRTTTADRRRWVVPGVAAALLVLLAAAGAWWMSPRFFPGQRGDGTEAPRLSIVVLPFSNLSGDPSQDYFADGVTEDLTTDLSRLAGSFVISRNTAFTFKGKAVDARQLGRELKVRYVLEAAYAGWAARSASTRSSSTQAPVGISGPSRSTSITERWRRPRTTSASRVAWRRRSVSSSSTSKVAARPRRTRMRWTSPCVAGRS